MKKGTPIYKDKWFWIFLVIVLIFCCLVPGIYLVLNAEPTSSVDIDNASVEVAEIEEVIPTIQPTSTSEPTEAPTPTPSRCIPASEEQLLGINAGLKGIQESNYTNECWAVKSDDFVKVYMVACILYGPGMEDGEGPAVFGIGGDPEDPNLFLSVDPFAKEFTDFPDAFKTDAKITIFADGLADAESCAKDNHKKN